MNILTVCRGNVGRSQFAEGLIKKMYPHHIVSSVGTKVFDKDGISKDGQLLKDLPGASKVVDVLREEGIDFSHASRTQLTPEMLDDKDLVIVMAEKENIPEYLANHPKMVYWDVRDPKGTDIDFHRIIKDEIKELLVRNSELFK